MQSCPSCGRQLNDEAVFCSGCGSKLHTKSTANKSKDMQGYDSILNSHLKDNINLNKYSKAQSLNAGEFDKGQKGSYETVKQNKKSPKSQNKTYALIIGFLFMCATIGLIIRANNYKTLALLSHGNAIGGEVNKDGTPSFDPNIDDISNVAPLISNEETDSSPQNELALSPTEETAFAPVLTQPSKYSADNKSYILSIRDYYYYIQENEMSFIKEISDNVEKLVDSGRSPVKITVYPNGYDINDNNSINLAAEAYEIYMEGMELISTHF